MIELRGTGRSEVRKLQRTQEMANQNEHERKVGLYEIVIK